MKKLFIAINALILTTALSFTMLANPQKKNDPATPKMDPNAGKLMVQRPQKVSLGCKNPGSHQDVSKTPNITNTTGKMLKKGTKLNWSATDGDKGVVTLDKDLAAGGGVSGLGNAGNGYSCQAWMLQ